MPDYKKRTVKKAAKKPAKAKSVSSSKTATAAHDSYQKGRRAGLLEAAQICLDAMENCANGTRFDFAPYVLCAVSIRVAMEEE